MLKHLRELAKEYRKNHAGPAPVPGANLIAYKLAIMTPHTMPDLLPVVETLLDLLKAGCNPESIQELLALLTLLKAGCNPESIPDLLGRCLPSKKVK